jgi:hypothetical protein
VNLRPNQPIQPTPLRGHKIGAFLKRRFSPTVIPIYEGGATEAQDVLVGPPLPKTSYTKVPLTADRNRSAMTPFEGVGNGTYGHSATQRTTHLHRSSQTSNLCRQYAEGRFLGGYSHTEGELTYAGTSAGMSNSLLDENGSVVRATWCMNWCIMAA